MPFGFDPKPSPFLDYREAFPDDGIMLFTFRGDHAKLDDALAAAVKRKKPLTEAEKRELGLDLPEDYPADALI